jgi:uncharacterized protein (TIGR00299 family) protein
MRIAYGDLIGGVSGDMFVAALLDAGLPLSKLERELKKIPGLVFELKTSKKRVHAIRAVQFQVICRQNQPARSWKEIRQLIRRSNLQSDIKNSALNIFALLAAAESRIHGVPVDSVHFHEVGAIDSIVDIISATVAVHELGIEAFHFSPVPLGRGITRSRHGPLPLPGPATLELLKKLPVEGVNVEAETVTPTGAAIISALGTSFGPHPPMIVERIGYGTGEKEFVERPNLFRVVLGSRQAAGPQEESMLVIETNIDDMSPEFYDYVFDVLFAAGARDVFLSPIQMKKNRPGTLLRVIAEPKDRDALARIILRETSTIGVRFYPVGRIILKRRLETLKTRYGAIKVKVAEGPDDTRRVSPEYDDLKRIAKAKKIPLRLLYDEIVRSSRK